VVAALMIELGAIALSLAVAAREAPIGAGERPAPQTPEASRGRSMVRGVLLATLFVSIGLGVIDVAVPIFAARHGSVANAGLLLGVLAAGTALGALLYGSHHSAMALERQLAVYAAPLVALIGAMALATGPLVLGALLVLTGMAIGPLYVVLYALIEQTVSAGDRTRAFSWEVTATNTGAAIGSACAGLVISGADLSTAFAVGGVAAGLGLLVALALLLAPAPARARQATQS
jgi:predicted MFS family arabinose efflux permease